jgi:sugar phosphate isomerase/epimerase
MYLSALATSLPLNFDSALRQLTELGFRYVDVVALTDRPSAHGETLADTGLLVSCAALGRGLAEGHTLDATDRAVRRAVLDEVKRQIDDAARLGVTHCYLVPGLDASPAGLARFTEICQLLADYAARRMIEVCVEHIPGRALPTVAATLAWLEQVRHENLKLLLDVGHCLISDEDPAQAIVQSGRRLGYVHLDDNDSVGDLHWPLLTGRLTSEMLEAVLTVLKMAPEDMPVSLELNPNNPDPLKALQDGKRVVEKLGGNLVG